MRFFYLLAVMLQFAGASTSTPGAQTEGDENIEEPSPDQEIEVADMLGNYKYAGANMLINAENQSENLRLYETTSARAGISCVNKIFTIVSENNHYFVKLVLFGKLTTVGLGYIQSAPQIIDHNLVYNVDQEEALKNYILSLLKILNRLLYYRIFDTMPRRGLSRNMTRLISDASIQKQVADTGFDRPNRLVIPMYCFMQNLYVSIKQSIENNNPGNVSKIAEIFQNTLTSYYDLYTVDGFEKENQSIFQFSPNEKALFNSIVKEDLVLTTQIPQDIMPRSRRAAGVARSTAEAASDPRRTSLSSAYTAIKRILTALYSFFGRTTPQADTDPYSRQKEKSNGIVELWNLYIDNLTQDGIQQVISEALQNNMKHIIRCRPVPNVGYPSRLVASKTRPGIDRLRNDGYDTSADVIQGMINAPLFRPKNDTLDEHKTLSQSFAYRICSLLMSLSINNPQTRDTMRNAYINALNAYQAYLLTQPNSIARNSIENHINELKEFFPKFRVIEFSQSRMTGAFRRTVSKLMP